MRELRHTIEIRHERGLTGREMGRTLQLRALLVGMCVVADQALGQTSPHGKLSIACEDCHTSSSWQVLASPMDFDHKTTKFPLSGLHQQVACKQCHTNLVFGSSASRCTDCHQNATNYTIACCQSSGCHNTCAGGGD